MKRILLVSMLIILLTSLSAWDIMRQTQFPSTFTAMSKGGTAFYSVGSGGAVAKSTDNGNTWSFVPNPAFNETDAIYIQLNDVSFYDENHGVIVGNDGMCAITENGGSSWTISGNVGAIFGTSDLKAVSYSSAGHIIAAGEGGLIAYSNNFGQTFTQLTSPMTTTINSAFIDNANMFFIAGGSAVAHRSADFGVNWTALTLNNSENPNIYRIKKIGTRLFCVGNKGYVGYSDNNGDSFTNFNGQGSTTTSFYDIAWNGTVGYAVANNGYVVKSTDNFNAGSLTTLSTYFTDAVRGCYFNSSNELIATAAYGALLKLDEPNSNWIDLVSNAFDLYNISIADANTWYTCGDRAYAYKTTDGGQTFQRMIIPGEKVGLYATKFFNANTGFITGKTTGKIFKTTNGGTDWTAFQVPNVAASKSYRELAFVNDQIGYAIGGPFNAKTTDGGTTWTMTTNTGIGSTATLYSGFFKSENVGFAGGSAGAVFVTTDGAQNWTTFTLGNKIITDIFFYDDNNGFILTEATTASGAVTQSGKLFKTTTGGLTAGDWTEVTLPVACGTLSSITRLANGNLYMAGFSNNVNQYGNSWAILKSTDNGTTWTQESLPALTFNPTQFRSIAFNDNKIVAVGSNQLIMRESLQPTDIYATNLFFSEYIEGSSNNKAIEIFNGTGQPVDLSAYSVKLGANGNAWSTTLTLNGTLPHGGVYIIANSGAAAEILNLADTTSTVTFYNGNDALGLFHNDALIDLFGAYNVMPAVNFTVAGVANGALDHTLVRKENVISPTTDWAASSGTDADNSQWIVYPVNTLTYLGSHTFNPTAPTATNAPSMSPSPGSYYNTVTVTLNCSTENATIYYTLDGTDPSNQSTQYTTPIVISQTTTVKAIAYAPGLTQSSISTGIYTIIVPVQVNTLAALRTQPADNTTIYQLTGEAVLTFKQSFRYQKYIQDATAAILIDDNSHAIITNYNIGDGITNLKGKMTEFGGMLQFVPVLDPGPASSTGNVINAPVITISEFNNNFENYEAELVKINFVHFNETGNFANGVVYHGVYDIDTLKIRTTFYDVNYIGDPIPVDAVHIVGIANSRADGNYFTPRDSADFIQAVIVANPPQNLTFTQTATSVTLNWTAPATGSTGTFAGYQIYRNNTVLNTTPITALTYTDETVASGMSYNYHVTALYQNPISESVPSNTVQVTIEGNILYPPQNLWATVVEDDVTITWEVSDSTVNIDRQSSITSRLELSKTLKNQKHHSNRINIQRNLIGFKVYRNDVLITTTTLPTTQLSFTDTNVPDGQYIYKVAAVYSEGESLPAQINVSVYANYIISSFPWNEGFEGTFPPMGWNQNDQDGDRNIWILDEDPTDAHSGSKCVVSASYINDFGPVTPDNWLITPKIQLPTVTGNQVIRLSYWIGAIDPDYPQEHYSCNISTTTNATAAFTALLSETLVNGDWVQKTIDLTSYSGQQIYLSFRHFNITDMFYIKLDDVKIELGVGNNDTPLTYTTKLGKNYPNPFNPSTQINFSIAEKAPVELDVYNVKGQKVRTLVRSIVEQGNHTITWNGKDDNNQNVGSGVYFYMMKSGKYTATGKMILMK